MTITTDNETILRSVLDKWKAAVDAHDPQHAAAIFTNDAIFQGLHPYTVGPQGVADYYASQPLGMTAAYRIGVQRVLDRDPAAASVCAAHGLVGLPG
jgi:hypothetical protein